MNQVNKLNLILAVFATATVAGLAVINVVQAGPTQAPPNGNPSFPAGPQGPQGPQGSVGNTGNTGSTGPQGDQGSPGQYGLAGCDWYGNEFVSYGWDSWCASDIGAYFACDGSRLYSISYVNKGACGTPNVPGFPGSPVIN